MALCALAAVPRAFAATTYFLVTIDTETSSGCGPQGCFPDGIEDRILGEHEGRRLGAPLIMDMLEQRGMRGNFFVNAYIGSVYPADDIKRFVQEMLERGHDVQFHAHLEFRCFKTCPKEDLACRARCIKEDSFIVGNTYENQLKILKEGADAIREWTGGRPLLAYRGGGYVADENTLKALRALEVPIDMSLSGPEHPLARRLPLNKAAELEGMLEIPLYDFTENLFGHKRNKHLDVETTSWPEQRAIIEEGIAHDVRVIVLMLHSFSFCEATRGCPAQASIDRFAKLLDYLKARPDVKVVTVSALWDAYRKDPTILTGGSGHVPETGYWLTLRRSAERFDEGWSNRLFLLGNLFACLAILGVAVRLLLRTRR
ncbi:MAG: hypothetical protein HY943_21660 [Gammaproteobacteria bacterium]|nr:hypothetical protein [Gammaproteobacteria bacterium]